MPRTKQDGIILRLMKNGALSRTSDNVWSIPFRNKKFLCSNLWNSNIYDERFNNAESKVLHFVKEKLLPEDLRYE